MTAAMSVTDRGAGPADPMLELRTLHRTGKLAAAYPQIRPLLARLSDAELATAGRLLAALDPDEVARAHPDIHQPRIAITGHGTLAELVPALTAQLARHGMLPRLYEAAFDSYIPELADPGSALYAWRPDLTLCVLDHQIILDSLPTPWGSAHGKAALAEQVDRLEGLARRHADSSATGHLVLNTLPLPASAPAALIDEVSRAEFSASWHEANARLLRLAAQLPAVSVIDLHPLIAAGVPAVDPRLSGYAKAHLTPALLAAYAREVGHLVRRLTGRTKKVLALDLDGTLWGGILAEDGPEGIEIGEGRLGTAFAAFQRTVAQLAAQGVLLAAVSKNDREPVLEAFGSHPGLVLREPDFVQVSADWEPKPERLRQLAEDLGLALDSFVFVDDTPAECGMVRDLLPEVDVVQLDAEPALHGARLLADGWFAVREVTAEDRARTTRYRSELRREEHRRGFGSLADYLADLGVTVRLEPAAPADIARVSQITMRTNQFNLTTVRLQQHDVARIAADPDSSVLCIRSADRFGDNGLVGAIFAHRDGDTVHLDNFLLSCRVFARGIEQACLAELLRLAVASGARAVTAEYRRSAKNSRVADFYPASGFAPVAAPAPAAAGAAAAFRHDLVRIPEPPAHVRFDARPEGIFA